MNTPSPSYSLILTLPPQHTQFTVALQKIEELLKENSQCYLFCFGQGVESIASAQAQALQQKGLHLYGCASSALDRDIELDERATWGGLATFNHLILNTDRLVSLDARAPCFPCHFKSTTQPDALRRKSILVCVGKEASPHILADALRLSVGLASIGQIQIEILFDSPPTGVEGKSYHDVKRLYENKIRVWLAPLASHSQATLKTTKGALPFEITPLASHNALEALVAQMDQAIWFE